MMEFIETSMFTRQIKQIATDDELMALQRELIAFPDRGEVIQQTGGLRKIRMATGAQGKSGGARVIYFLATREIVWLIMAYPKNVKDSLTDAEKAALKKLTWQLKNEV
ncbi:type II toxin-antitoxin system RelE/ParE family toxin [Enterobacteriaceae bacterium BIT-l23]|jgi:hypothetical protein|uniref:type II toxin-antitoxin system RelE/ParE family toxin n=1 Tax=Jejubacter sp. L23 TaxID=3092086 RepID=UPI00158478CC|nr:type II toxin-antitoxin system RelE/ParE family toxin [Enterobacteriaceae bacterium BIT-l23]